MMKKIPNWAVGKSMGPVGSSRCCGRAYAGHDGQMGDRVVVGKVTRSAWLAAAAVLSAVLVFVAGGCGSDVSLPSAATTTVAPATTALPATTATTTPTTVPPTSVTTAAPTTVAAVGAHRFPIDPPGVADYGPGHHDYPATDIFCPVGSNFVAVTDGTVDFVSAVDEWDPATDDPVVRGGLSVAIVGDDGVRYYGSHLSSVAPGIAPGVRVAAGQTLGLTGNSGNARNTDPHLHFGVSHPTTADDWQVRRGEVDTYPLLQAWEQGENVTPTVPAG